MSTSARIGGGEPVKLWWRRAARFLGWDGNPLRRSVDRAESLALTVLIGVLVIAGPVLAVSIGRVADAGALRQQRAEASWYPARATLLQGADESMTDASDWDIAWVEAKWTLRDGEQERGLVATPLDARAGQQVPIWLTPGGRLTHPKLSATDIRDQVTFAVLLTVTGWAVALALGAVAVRVLANRRRMAGWQREWDVSGPLWSRQG
jgi:hypothetical protein